MTRTVKGITVHEWQMRQEFWSEWMRVIMAIRYAGPYIPMCGNTYNGSKQS